MMCKDETLNTHPHDKTCESSTQPHAATSAKADHKDEDMYVMYIVHGSKNSEHGSAKDAKQSLQTCRVCKQYCEALGFLGQDMSVDSYRCWMNKCSDLSEYCYISVKPDDRFRWHAVSNGTRHQPCLGPKVEIRHVVVTHFLLHTDSKFIALASRFDRKFRQGGLASCPHQFLEADPSEGAAWESLPVHHHPLTLFLVTVLRHSLQHIPNW